ncbi:4-hydroxy-tetrahydrodipicolinate reductase [Pontibacter akesuensis]|uniref:4-hydroxy-tetrahydrodipicolinate reductase n=1 Tax=Pontibacter akesuensis TaxID=388950 RepID=A0A1I7GA24_9BACT|nr:4-hydroxy-tetrahydrodipicolinate reductase [Pontibacter akesuensis]GHA57832.1 4-hydroxy-tetrahydrodipicolinate reductase [Pontibacter akesuensis]SFU45297.1 dihydrodipicolinate reductase [Pontibacter akesuensis]
MRILLIGYGKMGKTIEQMAVAQGHEIAGRIDHENAQELQKYTSADTDVAIEFTHPASAFENISYCLKNGIPVVSGSTGWLSHFEEAKALCQEYQGAFFYASNYSVGVNLFFHFNEYIARKMQEYQAYGVSIREIHHLQKVDKPSGTGITTAEGILASYKDLEGWVADNPEEKTKLNIASEREPNVVGTHIVTYSSEVDQIELGHVAHSRAGFAEGAVMAAAWLQGRQGVYGMKDLLNL